MSEPGKSERQGVSIVAIGSFNPAIFHPTWFARQGLIRDAEAEASDVRVVSPDVTVVKLEWFTLQVTSERFSVETRDARKYQPLRDLVAATFGILEHTPIRAFGFNSIQWFQLDSEAAWHGFGNHFAPKPSWDGILDQPGLNTLTIQGTRPDCSANRVQISIQPAAVVQNGVVINVNEHYDVDLPEDDDSTTSASVLVETLEQGWDDFLDFSRTAAEHLLTEGRLTP